MSCALCKHPFEAGWYEPRVDSCGRTACLNCWTNIYSDAAGRRPYAPATCPFCRRILPEGEAHAVIPQNIDLIEVLRNPPSSADKSPSVPAEVVSEMMKSFKSMMQETTDKFASALKSISSAAAAAAAAAQPAAPSVVYAQPPPPPSAAPVPSLASSSSSSMWPPFSQAPGSSIQFPPLPYEQYQPPHPRPHPHSAPAAHNQNHNPYAHHHASPPPSAVAAQLQQPPPAPHEYRPRVDDDYSQYSPQPQDEYELQQYHQQHQQYQQHQQPQQPQYPHQAMDGMMLPPSAAPQQMPPPPSMLRGASPSPSHHSVDSFESYNAPPPVQPQPQPQPLQDKRQPAAAPSLSVSVPKPSDHAPGTFNELFIPKMVRILEHGARAVYEPPGRDSPYWRLVVLNGYIQPNQRREIVINFGKDKAHMMNVINVSEILPNLECGEWPFPKLLNLGTKFTGLTTVRIIIDTTHRNPTLTYGALPVPLDFSQPQPIAETFQDKTVKIGHTLAAGPAVLIFSLSPNSYIDIERDTLLFPTVPPPPVAPKELPPPPVYPVPGPNSFPPLGKAASSSASIASMSSSASSASSEGFEVPIVDTLGTICEPLLGNGLLLIKGKRVICPNSEFSMVLMNGYVQKQQKRLIEIEVCSSQGKKICVSVTRSSTAYTLADSRSWPSHMPKIDLEDMAGSKFRIIIDTAAKQPCVTCESLEHGSAFGSIKIDHNSLRHYPLIVAFSLITGCELTIVRDEYIQ